MEPLIYRSWREREKPAALDVTSLAERLGIPAVAAEVAVRRQYSALEELQSFLSSSLADLPDPDGIPGMPEAATRLAAAVQRKEKILVHGDYDVDGITGTALLVDFLRECRAEVNFHIPLRLRDGYGLSAAALSTAAEDGVEVVVSVDCGIGALAEAEQARKAGIDLLITDHHQPGETLPEAAAVVNPRLDPCSFPDRDLAGVGVAFFLAVATRRRLRDEGYFEQGGEPDLRQLLDLTALGTIADVVPLQKVNRLLVKKGLELLSHARRPGVAALLEVAGVARVSSGSVGFQLAPRLNAAGRLEDAALGVELLLCRDPARAADIARQLDLFNRERREIEQATLDEALVMVEALPDAQQSIVLWSDNWHPGVIGIVASRLVERFHRPTLLIACSEGEGKGSARSVPGYHLYRALKQCAECLEGFGGHAAAAGFSLKAEQLEAFAQSFETVCQGSPELKESEAQISYDIESDLRQCDMPLAQTLESFAPFGMGNPEPMFCLRQVHVQQLQQLGGGHLRFTLRQEGMTVPAIAFSMAERRDEFSGAIDLLAAIQVNRWKGSQNVQLVVKDVRPAEEASG